VVEAKNLIEACNEEYAADDDLNELKEFQEERKKKIQRTSKVMPLIISALFFGLANLPMKESAREFQYVLIGISLFFFILFIFSFLKAKDNSQSSPSLKRVNDGKNLLASHSTICFVDYF
jgi:hypothetical protein